MTRLTLAFNLNSSVKWHVERSLAVIASASGTCTIAPVVVAETRGNGESVGRNKTDVGTGTIAGVRWVSRSRLDQSTIVAINTTLCGLEISDSSQEWSIRDWQHRRHERSRIPECSSRIPERLEVTAQEVS